MMDENPVCAEPSNSERHLGAQLRCTPRRGPARARRCGLCARPDRGDFVDAGGDVGIVHRACFVEWDRRQEALEAAGTLAMALPPPGEFWSELEIAVEVLFARAA